MTFKELRNAMGMSEKDYAQFAALNDEAEIRKRVFGYRGLYRHGWRLVVGWLWFISDLCPGSPFGQEGVKPIPGHALIHPEV